MGNPTQVFIGTACTHVPLKVFPEYKRVIESVADLVEGLFGCKARYALEDSDPQLSRMKRERRPPECYHMDRELVEGSQLVIAEVSFPSTGLGQELQIAEYNSIPIILCYKDWGCNIAETKDYRTRAGEPHSIELGNRIVTVMVQGNPSVIGDVPYNSTPDCVSKLDAFLRQHYGLPMKIDG